MKNKQKLKMISQKKLQNKINWKPHKNQQKVLNCPEREIALCAGRRWGKSALCAYKALMVLAQNISDMKRGRTKKASNIWIVAPTYDLSQKVFEYISRWFTTVYPSMSRQVKTRPNPNIKTKIEINGRNYQGPKIECKSAENPTSLLGEETDLLIVDEAARIAPNIWSTYLYPTTMSRQGQTVFISTPYGKNWFFEEWQRLKPQNSAFHFESRDNPELPQGEWERAQELFPKDVFDQEYKALFKEQGASVFKYEDIRAVIEDTLKEPENGHSYVMGLDLAKYGDYTVITLIDRDTKEVVFWDRSQKETYTRQKNKVLNISNNYNNTRIVIDSMNVGASFGDELRENGAWVDDYTTAGAISKDWTKKGNKQRLVERLIVAIEGKKIKIPEMEALISELDSYTCELTPTGKITYVHPQGLHDDCVDSLALAIWGINLDYKAPKKNAFKEELEKRSKPQKNKSFI